MYEKEISEVRNEIEDARKYLEKLTTEVMIRKLRDAVREIFSFHSTRRKNDAVWRGIIIQFAFRRSLF